MTIKKRIKNERGCEGKSSTRRKERGHSGGRVWHGGRSAGRGRAPRGGGAGQRASLPPCLPPSLGARRAPLPPRRRLFPLWLPPMAQKAAAEAGPPSPFHPHAESAGVAPATRGHVTSTCSAGRRPPSAAICFPQSAPARSRHLRGRGTGTPAAHTPASSKSPPNRFQKHRSKPNAKQPQSKTNTKRRFTRFSNLFKWKVTVAAR